MSPFQNITTHIMIIIAKKSAGRLQKKDNSRTESSAHGIGILLLYDTRIDTHSYREGSLLRLLTLRKQKTSSTLILTTPPDYRHTQTIYLVTTTEERRRRRREKVNLFCAVVPLQGAGCNEPVPVARRAPPEFVVFSIFQTKIVQIILICLPKTQKMPTSKKGPKWATFRWGRLKSKSDYFRGPVQVAIQRQGSTRVPCSWH